jgi:hypothetical protein
MLNHKLITPMARNRDQWFLIGLIVALMGCTPKTLIVGQVTNLVDDGVVAFTRDNDLDLIEKALPANIKLLETLLVSSPADGRLMTLLSQLYGSYAFGFGETRLEESRYQVPPGNDMAVHRLTRQVTRYYERGANYALTALEKNVPGATDAFQKVTAISAYLKKLRVKDVAPLFWYGFNLGAMVNHNLDDIRIVSRAHVARQVMERVIELDPAYHHGGAHLFLMAYYGSRSPMMGGDQKRAGDHYQQLKKIAGDDYLLADLVYARFCLYQQQDRQGFVEMMTRIIDHPSTASDVALYNAIAGRRAAIYLSAVNSLFE